MRTFAPRMACGLLIALTALSYSLLAMRNPHVGLLADDAIYLLMADIYSPYREAVGAVFDHVRQYSHLPPFYSMVLALAGGGVGHLVAARLATAVCMTLAWTLCYGWLRREGVPRGSATLLTLFGAWTPVTLIHTVDLWSEGLSIALTLLCLIVLQQTRNVRGSDTSATSLWLFGGLGCALACSIATRSIGVALLPAVLLAFGWRRPLALGITLLATLVCSVALSSIDLGAAAPSYGALLLQHYAADPLMTLARQVGSVFAALPGAALYDLFQWRAPTAWQWAAIALPASACLLGFCRALLACAPAAVYTLCHLGIVLLWPFPGLTDRFIYPLLPYALWCMWYGAALVDSRGRAGMVLALLLLALAAPACVSTWKRAVTPLPQAGLDSFRATRYWLDATRSLDPVPGIATLAAHERVAASIASDVPPTDCIYTQQVHLVLAKALRPTFLPPPPAVMERGPPWGCRYFLLVADAMNGRPPLYPLAYLGGIGTVVAVHRPTDATTPDAVTAILMRVD